MLPLPSAEHVSALVGISATLLTRYCETGELADLVGAAQPYERATAAVEAALVIGRRAAEAAEHGFLDLAVSMFQNTICLLPAWHSSRRACQNNLANTLQTRYTKTGTIADLDLSIKILEEVLQFSDASMQPIIHNNLGKACWTKFGQTGQLADLDQAIKHFMEVRDCLPGTWGSTSN
jgi:hypothetical protein